MIKAVVFDAYGTLYDVNSVVQKCEEFFPKKGAEISKIWRQKQLEYSWLNALMDRYEDFWIITGNALCYALEELELEYNEDIIRKILRVYLNLKLYPEVIEALEAFRPCKLAILSNGTSEMLRELATNTCLNKHLDEILSVDPLKTYKPNPEVYKLAVEKLGVNKEEILFVSSNGWDVSGAKSFGFIVGWVNRLNKPTEKLGFKPDYKVSNLKELVDKTMKIQRAR